MRTLTLHTADELAVRWKRRAMELADNCLGPGDYEAGMAQGYRVAAAELQAIVLVSQELEATHHGDPEVITVVEGEGLLIRTGPCRECGRGPDHRWHTEQGPGFIGDGQVPHEYMP